MEIFLVMGIAGDYSDRQEWPVAAYFTVELAQAHIVAAQKEAARIQLELSALGDGYDDWKAHEEARERIVGSSPFDPEMQNGFDAAGYFMTTVKLREALPELRA